MLGQRDVLGAIIHFRVMISDTRPRLDLAVLVGVLDLGVAGGLVAPMKHESEVSNIRTQRYNILTAHSSLPPRYKRASKMMSWVIPVQVLLKENKGHVRTHDSSISSDSIEITNALDVVELFRDRRASFPLLDSRHDG